MRTRMGDRDRKDNIEGNGEPPNRSRWVSADRVGMTKMERWETEREIWLKSRRWSILVPIR